MHNNSARKRKAEFVKTLKGYAFIAPNYLLMLVFSIFPILFSFALSFTSWDLISGLKGIQFVGIDNFVNLFKNDAFIKAFFNNVYFTLGVVPVTIIIALFLAILLNDYVFGKAMFRLMFYIPNISNVVAVSIIWTILYSSNGPIVAFLSKMGMESIPKFLGDPNWAMPSVIFMSIWMSLGYCAMIYIGGLQSIPEELYEAARIDGAGWWRRFINVTVPMLSPTTFFLVITQIISSFKVFGQIQVMTDGGPAGATTVIVYEIYTTAFRFYRFGSASAMALLLFIVIMAITLIQWRGQKKWVNY